MQSLDREQFATLLKQQRVKPRLVRELRFVPEDIVHWHNLELLTIGTRSGAEGVLLAQTTGFYLLPYEMSKGMADKATGRSRAITCDFCYTWQQGTKAGRITFRRPSDDHTFTYLCCGDLRCSLHVRNLTPESTLSRTQLHEDITTEQRILRLKDKLDRIITTIGISPVQHP
jgi:hypothetical protein